MGRSAPRTASSPSGPIHDAVAPPSDEQTVLDVVGQLDFDPDGLKRTHAIERDKRIRPDGNAQFVPAVDSKFANFSKDPWAPAAEREPIVDESQVIVAGGGFGGLLAGARLRACVSSPRASPKRSPTSVSRTNSARSGASGGSPRASRSTPRSRCTRAAATSTKRGSATSSASGPGEPPAGARGCRRRRLRRRNQSVTPSAPTSVVAVTRTRISSAPLLRIPNASARSSPT